MVCVFHVDQTSGGPVGGSLGLYLNPADLKEKLFENGRNVGFRSKIIAAVDHFA
jgi:hypothetical protein